MEFMEIYRSVTLVLLSGFQQHNNLNKYKISVMNSLTNNIDNFKHALFAQELIIYINPSVLLFHLSQYQPWVLCNTGYSCNVFDIFPFITGIDHDLSNVSVIHRQNRNSQD